MSKSVYDFREVITKAAIKHRMSAHQIYTCMYTYKSLTSAYRIAEQQKEMESGLIELVMEISTPVFMAQLATIDDCIFSDIELKTDLMKSLKNYQFFLSSMVTAKCGSKDGKAAPLPMLNTADFRKLFSAYVRVLEQLFIFNDAEAERSRKGEQLVSTIRVENDKEYIDLPDSIGNYLDFASNMPNIMISALFHPVYESFIHEMSPAEQECYALHLEFTKALDEKSTISSMRCFNELREKSLASNKKHRVS